MCFKNNDVSTDTQLKTVMSWFKDFLTSESICSTVKHRTVMLSASSVKLGFHRRMILYNINSSDTPSGVKELLYDQVVL